jgi:hypothetical protein
MIYFQRTILENYFQSGRYPNTEAKLAIAAETGLSYAQILAWFQNRRFNVCTIWVVEEGISDYGHLIITQFSIISNVVICNTSRMQEIEMILYACCCC